MMRKFTVSRNGESQTDDAAFTVSPFEMLGLLIRRKKIIAYGVLATMVLAAAVTLLIPNKYTSTATILPSGGQDKMAELKSLAGLSSLSDQDENSSQLFPVILASCTIQDAVLGARYDFVWNGDTKQVALPEYFGQDNPDKLRRALSEISSISLDKKTGVISLGVETEYPALSQAILQQYIDQLEVFNLHKRRTQAGERAAYLERELAACKVELTAAEDSLSSFQAVNRGWATTSDPEVGILLGRLQREVETRNQKYLYLLQEYEIARLDSRKDVPVVRILDKPTLPVQKSSPKRAIIVILSGILALVGTVFGIFAFEALRRSSQGPERPAFEGLRTEFSREFPRLNRVVNRLSETSRK